MGDLPEITNQKFNTEPRSLNDSGSVSAESGRPMILRWAEESAPLRINKAFTAESGLTAEQLAHEPLLSWIHPEDRIPLEKALEAGAGQVQARHRAEYDNWLSLEWRIETQDGLSVALGLPQQEPLCATRPLKDGLPPLSATLMQTLEAMAHVVESKSGGLRCSILLVDANHEYISVGAGPSLPDEYNAAVEGLRIGPTVGSCGTAAFWNVPVVVENIAEDILWIDLRDVAAIAGVCACWSVPISTGDDVVLGAMALYDTKPNSPTRHQMEVLEISARMVGMAIERDRLELQLREATKMEAVSVLAAGIAHDFNNLLAAIMGNAELALADLADDAQSTVNLTRIIAASGTAAELCSQILEYAGQGKSFTETFECTAWVRELGDLMQAAISRKVTLDYELHGSPLGIVADRSQLQQVLMNLITNASEAYGGEEGRVVIGISAATFTRNELKQRHPSVVLEPGEYLCIRVSDSGAGMAPEDRARIFDPFFTTKPTGRGLGLAAVQGIVRAHGGAISVQSTPGLGTTFELVLPRVPLEPVEQQSAVQGMAATKSARILVAEDESSVREMLVMALERAGYDVVEAIDGQEVVDIFKRDPAAVDCVLLDFNMPKLDGEEVFSQLRQIQPDVCVLLSSGFTEQEILQRFQGAGLTGFVHKPARLEALLAEISKALEKSSR